VAVPTDSVLAPRLRLSVLRLARRLRQHAQGGITASQLSALAALERDGPLTLSALAETERVAAPTLTRIVNALVEQGLVVRRPDDADRRVSWVETTRAGRALVRSVRRARDAYLAERLHTLRPDELEVLARAAELLERIVEEEP
jgi:DNA-binding MarR family transcriptional regulator